MSRRTAFFVSDQTGVTAETLGHSLMTQFEGLEFRAVTLPFVSSIDKAHEAVERINRAAVEEGLRPIIFSTLVQDELRDIVLGANGLFLDFFGAFVGPLERELNTRSSHRAGRAHGMADLASYTTRINATNFALTNDDGTGHDESLDFGQHPGGAVAVTSVPGPHVESQDQLRVLVDDDIELVTVEAA